MDAFLSRSGMLDAKTDIALGEVYLLANGGLEMTEAQTRAIVEDDYGYALRSYKKTNEIDTKWDELGNQE